MTKLRLLLTAVIVFGTHLLGCATLDPALKVETFGVMDPAKDKQIAENATENAPHESNDVTVTQGEIPEGIDIQEENTKLVVKPGYENRYEVIGMVEADYMGVKGVVFKNLLWTWKDYDSTGRKVACYAQAPLKLLTLSIWAYFPWAYPCMKVAPKDPADRAADLIATMKKGAAAMGGNRIIMTGSGDLTVTTVSQYGSSTSHHKTVKMRGFVVMDHGGSADTSTTRDEPIPSSESTADFF